MGPFLPEICDPDDSDGFFGPDTGGEFGPKGGALGPFRPLFGPYEI